MKLLWILILFFWAGCTFQIRANETVSGPIPKTSESASKYGIVTGKVSFGPLRPGPERVGDDSSEETKEIAQKMYETHKVAVLSEDGKKTIGKVVINKKGIYRIELPPGKYLLQITPADFGKFSKQAIKAEVVAGKTLQLDISIDTGMR